MSPTISRGAPRAVADISEGLILASVEIAASAERVFRALTSEELVEWWSAAATYRTTKWTGDLRVGGAWRAEGVNEDGTPFSVTGEFLEIDPPRRIVQTWRADWDGASLTTVTYRLDPIASGTRLTVRHAGFAGRPESCQGHTEGWEIVLHGLAAHFAASVRS